MSEVENSLGEAQTPTVLSYVKMAPPPRWSIPLSTAILITSFLLQATFLPCLCVDGTIKMNFSFAIDGLFIARVLLARLLRETNRGWIFYAILLLTSLAWISALAESETVNLCNVLRSR